MAILINTVNHPIQQENQEIIRVFNKKPVVLKAADSLSIEWRQKGEDGQILKFEKLNDSTNVLDGKTALNFL